MWKNSLYSARRRSCFSLRNRSSRPHHQLQSVRTPICNSILFHFWSIFSFISTEVDRVILYPLSAFSMFILIEYPLVHTWWYEIFVKLFQSYCCVGVKKCNLAGQQDVTIYLEFTPQCIITLYNFKLLNVWEAQIGFQNPLGVNSLNGTFPQELVPYDIPWVILHTVSIISFHLWWCMLGCSLWIWVKSNLFCKAHWGPDTF